ncbi:DUF805 domain-containing protein [Leptolyngbyaceae cyanobacterium CCMR0082]|uniref:DUF805 domain-containing protein n=2 Tax=Adonisia turfae TaxID=2950184 RepID=A0A6M0SFV2_9CYAN|nr:DUF805 domain-containing protein [Adonisia turfae]MDV3351166.1 DUF805 domain-containing protein [Leptothoe sp. LEGE 181152]NEZ56101.1 DUF805 domain-containing protein [Adonisia turfae CCMR0081]NEZ67196.1 DUF805 domain-containing protein [Adonisia turfae CCMR0082]
MEWYIKVLKNYAVFEGRARRKEYWMFVLFNFLAALCLGFIEGFLGAFSNTDQSILSFIYNLAVLIPSIAVGIRRMHDVDRSGWWILCPIVNLVFAVTDGTAGSNKFGPDPKANER